MKMVNGIIIDLIDRRDGGNNADNGEQREDNTPRQTEGHRHIGRSPRHDDGGQEGSYRLDKLTEGQCGCHVLT